VGLDGGISQSAAINDRNQTVGVSCSVRSGVLRGTTSQPSISPPAASGTACRLERGEIQYEAATHSALSQPSMRLGGLVGR
jgi:hypothetical protein